MSVLLALVPFFSGGGGVAWGRSADGFLTELGLGAELRLGKVRAEASAGWVRFYLSERVYTAQSTPSGGAEERSWSVDLVGPRFGLGYGEKKSLGVWASAVQRLNQGGWLGGFGAEAWLWGSAGGVGLEWGAWPPASSLSLRLRFFLE